MVSSASLETIRKHRVLKSMPWEIGDKKESRGNQRQMVCHSHSGLRSIGHESFAYL